MNLDSEHSLLWTWANLTRVFLFKTRHTLGGSHYFVSVFLVTASEGISGGTTFLLRPVKSVNYILPDGISLGQS